jgi:Mg-chelatase subunit ChlD
MNTSTRISVPTKLLAVALLGATAATIAWYPEAETAISKLNPPASHTATNPEQSLTAPIVQKRPKIEVVFALDTTGSMGGLIQAAKENIWSIATTMAQADPAPEISIGLVAYRDRGDAYVTRVVDLSSDLDSVYSTLMDFEAAGGGDGPESVNAALYDSIHKISWSQDSDAYRVVFLVGDAPPHMDYQDDVKYPQSLQAANARGIIVNTIQCGEHQDTILPWQQIAQLAGGRYFQVEQSGSAVAVATPFDDRIAALSRSLDETRVYYGNAEQKKKQMAKLKATEKLHRESSAAAQAKRAGFNASGSGKKNFLGEGELVDDVASGRIALEEVAVAELPAPMQAMSPEEQKAVIAEKAQKRQALKEEIRTLSKQRKDFIKKKVEAMETAETSLDYQIFGAVKEQTKDMGITYEADAPSL